MSFGQQRLWFLDQMEPGSGERTVPVPVRLPGELDVAALDAALGGVIARHEVLRTRLVADPDGVAHQVIDPPSRVALPIADVRAAADPAAAALALVAADAVTPIDLGAGAPIRACLVLVAPDDQVLVLSAHRAVFDELSAGIFRRELMALYAAFRAGGPDPLSPLPVQYADYAVWQRRWLAGEVLRGSAGVLAGTAGGAAGVLELPADRPRPPVRSAEGALVRFGVPVPVTEGLREVARRGGATMFMTVLAAFMVLLGRYAGLEDVAVGTPVANRGRAETEGLIGFFVNTLVMRADLSGDPSFAELLGRVRATALAAYAHQDLPFEQLVDDLVTVRDRSRTPLFQAFFEHDVADTAEAEFDVVPPLKSDLAVRLLEQPGGGLTAEIQYSVALFDAATVQRLAGHLGVLLAEIAADPGRRLSAQAILSAGEREEMLAGWNDTQAPVPAVGGVHELIAARARMCPDVVAVTAGDRSLSYAGLTERAGRLAGYLREAGVGAESVVGVCLPRGADLVVAVLATWLAGGAYVPLDPGYPAGRLAFMLDDSGARVLVGDRGTAAGLRDELPAGMAAVWLDDPAVQARLAAASAPAPVAPVPGRLAYVIYTSGSTGWPKGVMVGHRSLVNYVTWFNRRFAITSEDRVLVSSSPSFDAFGIELYPGLAAGGSLVMVPASGSAADSRLLLAAAARGRVSLLAVVPAVLRLLVADPLLARCAAVRQVVCGGEQLTGEVAAALTERLRVPLRNVYGPTEATIDVTSYSQPWQDRARAGCRSGGRSTTPACTSLTDA